MSEIAEDATVREILNMIPMATIAMLVDRMDVLAHHLGLLDTEHAVLRRDTDILALHLGRTIEEAK